MTEIKSSDLQSTIAWLLDLTQGGSMERPDNIVANGLSGLENARPKSQGGAVLTFGDLQAGMNVWLLVTEGSENSIRWDDPVTLMHVKRDGRGVVSEIRWSAGGEVYEVGFGEHHIQSADKHAHWEDDSHEYTFFKVVHV